MTTKQFLEKWKSRIIGSQQKPASQLIIDFVKDKIDNLVEFECKEYSEHFINNDFKGSISYDVYNLLEICDKENPTYPILVEMQKDLA